MNQSGLVVTVGMAVPALITTAGIASSMEITETQRSGQMTETNHSEGERW